MPTDPHLGLGDQSAGSCHAASPTRNLGVPINVPMKCCGWGCVGVTKAGQVVADLTPLLLRTLALATPTGFEPVYPE